MFDRFKGKNFHRTLRKLFKRRIAVVGLAICLALIVTSLIFTVKPYDLYQMDASQKLLAPSWQHPFGTDEMGRDVMMRILDSSKISVYIGLVAVAIALAFGTALGLVAGYFGGKTDTVITAVLDAVWAFPTLILALAISVVLGTGLTNVILAIGIVFTPGFARVVRSMVLTVRQTEYVESAVAIGLNRFEIIVRHVLPNITSVIIVQASLNAAQAIISEASLSFLGLGIQPPEASWGSMLKKGFDFLTIAPWMSIFPGIFIFLVVMGLNFFGDGLRDALDVKIRTD